MPRRLERAGSMLEAVMQALEGWQAGMWTALPATIVSFNAAAMTVQCQPSIQARILDTSGEWHWETMPLLVDVPLVFPNGGGYSLTFPMSQGDEVLVIFSSRCIDSWWQSGGVQVQAELRMHDLSDGFAIAGVRSQPRVLPSISADSVQLRNDAGDTYVEIEGTTVNIVAAVVNVTAPSVNVVASTEVMMTTPDLKVTGEITVFEGTPQECRIGDIIDTYNLHTHDGVTVGAGNTGNPNQLIP